MKRVAAAVLAAGLLVTAPLFWIGGEAHKRNCVEASRASCSVLPWKDGQPKPAVAKPQGNPFDGGPLFGK